jgi:hypothetical protein
MPHRSPSAATLGMLVNRLRNYERDVSDNVERHTEARRLREATDAGIALVRPLADTIHIPQAIFGPEQQIVSDVSHLHRHRITPQHGDAAAIRALINAPDDVNVLPRVIRRMTGGDAEAARILRALYVAARVNPISHFRGPATARTAKMDEMRAVGREFDRRLAGARAAARRRLAEATRVHRQGRGRKRSTRKGRKRSKRGKRGTRRGRR